MTARAKPSGRPFEPGIRRATQLSRSASLLLCLGLSLVATACGAYIDGDQWVDVTVTNTTSEPVTLNTHSASYLSPGQKTVLHVNSNNDPQAVRVYGPDGRVLGCLTFLFHTTLPETRTTSVSDVTACDEKVRSFPG